MKERDDIKSTDDIKSKRDETQRYEETRGNLVSAGPKESANFFPK